MMDVLKNTLLLSTKLKIPAPRKNYVVRRVLFEKLSQCTDMGAIFVCGGAGTGKTTLLSSFLKEREMMNVCWLSLDSSNANVYSFWLYFTAALAVLWEDGESFLSLIRSNTDASHMENLLILLINRLYGEEDYYMVLDDIHCIKDGALVRTLEFFIKEMPANFHFFMLSREEPPVYLGPLAIAGRLLFIDGKQMELLQEEGIAFLKNTLRFAASEEELNQLNVYAEGWIGGLQLVAAAGGIGGNSGRLLRAGGGIAAEYLNREVLKSLTKEEREFLIKTGFLSYFDAEICGKLFENFTKMDFNQIVDRLVEKNLFIICMDEQTGIYRYHNILSEYLDQQFLSFSEELQKEIYIKTAHVFKERGDDEEALRLYCKAGAYKEVLQVAEGMGGRIEAWNYLNEVPVESLILNADLAAQCLMYNLGNLNIERCYIIFEKFKEHYGNSEIYDIVRFAEAYVSKDGRILPRYHVLSLEQMNLLHLGPVAKAMILVENSAGLVELMQYEEAEECIKAAIKISAGANIFVDFFASNQLAQIYEETGRLNESLSCYEKSKGLFKYPSMMSGIGVNYYFGLAGVYMRRMELDKAKEILNCSAKLLEEKRIHVDITDMTLYYHQAEMKFLQGDNEAGASCIADILSKYSNYSILTLGRLLHELDCADMLSDNLADYFLDELESSKSYRLQPFMRLLCARLLFKKGKTKEAFKETEEILTFSRLQKNKIRLIEADLLKIYMLLHISDKQGREREISNLLHEAIYYAKDERILMPFYLDRVSLMPLLLKTIAQAAGNNTMTASEIAFIKEIIRICGYQDSNSKRQDLLSVRELEVLEEMALGITNREIAEKLCISMATVKTHVLNIFGKLEVSSRMLAVEKARKERLIQ